MTYNKSIFITLTFLIFTSSFVKADEQESDKTALKSAGKLELLDLENLPSWTKTELRERFIEIRDKKFLSFEGEKRRVPWLFGRDGCHMRATHFILEAERLGYTAPQRIFIFGNLEMRGVMIPNGAVQPWFHAAPIIKVDGEPMVLDPSISFSKAMPLNTWIDYVAKDKSQVVYSICHANTYLPKSQCQNPGPLNMELLEKETQLFLKFEKNILNYMGLSFH